MNGVYNMKVTLPFLLVDADDKTNWGTNKHDHLIDGILESFKGIHGFKELLITNLGEASIVLDAGNRGVFVRA